MATLGIYFWNSGSPELRLYQEERGAAGRSWAARYSTGALAAGTQLEVTAVGSTISFLVNGVQRISVTDGSFTGGAPGIMAYGSGTADNWSGGTAPASSFGRRDVCRGCPGRWCCRITAVMT